MFLPQATTSLNIGLFNSWLPKTNSDKEIRDRTVAIPARRLRTNALQCSVYVLNHKPADATPDRQPSCSKLKEPLKQKEDQARLCHCAWCAEKNNSEIRTNPARSPTVPPKPYLSKCRPAHNALHTILGPFQIKSLWTNEIITQPIYKSKP